MDAQTFSVVVGTVITVGGSTFAAMRTARVAYDNAVDRRAKEIENERLIKQADDAIAAKDAEIASLTDMLAAKDREIDEERVENERLWQLLRHHGIMA